MEKKWELMSIRLQEQSNWEAATGSFSEDQEEESSCFFECRKEGFFPVEVWVAQRALFSYQEAVSCRDFRELGGSAAAAPSASSHLGSPRVCGLCSHPACSRRLLQP